MLLLMAEESIEIYCNGYTKGNITYSMKKGAFYGSF